MREDFCVLSSDHGFIRVADKSIVVKISDNALCVIVGISVQKIINDLYSNERYKLDISRHAGLKIKSLFIIIIGEVVLMRSRSLI